MDRLPDGWCAALDRDTLRCRIYEQRPLICREFEEGGPDCVAERAGWNNHQGESLGSTHLTR
jgi:Fe-S-cluster containining protein